MLYIYIGFALNLHIERSFFSFFASPSQHTLPHSFNSPAMPLIKATLASIILIYYKKLRRNRRRMYKPSLQTHETILLIAKPSEQPLVVKCLMAENRPVVPNVRNAAQLIVCF